MQLFTLFVGCCVVYIELTEPTDFIHIIIWNGFIINSYYKMICMCKIWSSWFYSTHLYVCVCLCNHISCKESLLYKNIVFFDQWSIVEVIYLEQYFLYTHSIYYLLFISDVLYSSVGSHILLFKFNFFFLLLLR